MTLPTLATAVLPLRAFWCKRISRWYPRPCLQSHPEGNIPSDLWLVITDGREPAERVSPSRSLRPGLQIPTPACAATMKVKSSS